MILLYCIAVRFVIASAAAAHRRFWNIPNRRGPDLAGATRQQRMDDCVRRLKIDQPAYADDHHPVPRHQLNPCWTTE